MLMRTGFNGSTEDVAERYISTMVDIFLPVLEQSMVIAGHYSKGCERDVLLPEDVEYATKYCAMRKVGQTLGSTMPEIYEGDSDDSGSEIEEVPVEECPEFVRYSGDDPFLNEVNLAYDMWNTWVPQSPAEEMLKNAVDSNEHLGA
tara:strand:- start:535 stop:972 length:438 start_codon:yes stop_codon:yes gene_type:complete